MLSIDDEAFKRVKVQALCIIPDLDMSEIEFFKTMVDGRLMDMEEASPEAEVSMDATTNNRTSEAQQDEHHDV